MKETIERKNIIITKNIQNKEQLFHYLAEYMVSQKEIDAKHLNRHCGQGNGCL